THKESGPGRLGCTTMKVVISIAVSIAVGLVVFVVASYLLVLYTWTAIHSGWSQAQIDRFYLALRVGPVILGIVAASAAYGLIVAIKTVRAMADAAEPGPQPRH